ncbi:hypothetical protein BGZ99_004143, partial [Dissophora globulifera]
QQVQQLLWFELQRLQQQHREQQQQHYKSARSAGRYRLQRARNARHPFNPIEVDMILTIDQYMGSLEWMDLD